jgi:glycosyltransferase involved in cell wall biosynthesis
VTARINLSADFYDRGGWGRHARNFGAALARRAHVALCGTNTERRHDHEPDGDVTAAGAAGFDYAAEPLSGAAGVALGSIAFLPHALGTPRILATVWETTNVPPAYVHALAEADAVWVPTEWGRHVFVGAGLRDERVRVVPEGVDSELFRPSDSAETRERFRFLCVGKWEVRKGTALLVRAFAEEFSAAEPVELVMHCHNIYLGGFRLDAAIARELPRLASAPPRISASAAMSLAGLIALMQASDAFVLPTRGEAWGLPILEAMACGLPCIVTDYGGHRTFADATNSYLIGVERMAPVHDPANFSPSLDWGAWAEPDVAHLRELMRHVFEHRGEAQARGAAARVAAQRWTWDRAARAALEQLAAT